MADCQVAAKWPTGQAAAKRPVAAGWLPGRVAAWAGGCLGKWLSSGCKWLPSGCQVADGQVAAKLLPSGCKWLPRAAKWLPNAILKKK